ncbi:putative quercetin 2,3-dioxygenase [Porphyridium purpureum]|uniref:Putative quercetin 2,3-dioxygenase n=1 Tax=Porphyridium purpureum TaxID=35688 RepID=A0A5J4YKT4_PORPP|nr:putative quercetin 2,3-dioxygenase [Porphyridium purpureum]|eukprot:POR9183..scf261_15
MFVAPGVRWVTRPARKVARAEWSEFGFLGSRSVARQRRGVRVLPLHRAVRMMAPSQNSGNVRKVAEDMLYVSEPNPMYFGNPSNENMSSNPRWTNANWLKSRFHFSFAEYMSRSNSNFGVLRVMNDDLVQPARGFGSHPHRNMEICTFVVDGELTHQDSMGTAETLGPNSIQFMTAGTGVVHAERNMSPEEPLRFIQMWIVPRRSGLEPNYGSMRGDKCNWAPNTWQHLVSDVERKDAATPVQINQDANVFVAQVESGCSVPLRIEDDRQAYFLQVRGSVAIQNTASAASAVLKQHEAAELEGALDLSVVAQGEDGALCLVVEMSRDGSSRF